MRLVTQIKLHNKDIRWGRDVFSGIVIALVSIPIAMGYAQIAGLPVVYGLYGSLLPVLVYTFLTTSPQFVIGVDAMPAAMVGGMLAQLGIVGESEDAMRIIPLMAILVGMWFLVFYLVKAGRVVKYISIPVMSGFISGVGLTIILMQIPKLFGGSPGTGEMFLLLRNIVREWKNLNYPSLILGIGTIAIILLCKKWIPKVPMTVVMMILGAILQVAFHLDSYGVKVLPSVSGGLPKIVLPDVKMYLVHPTVFLMQSLSIAAVIMAQTLLASGNYARMYGDKINYDSEMLAFAGMNAAASIVGCCPVNGSVSRSGMADSMGVRSQVMGLSSVLTMLLVLLFGTPFLKFLPVPVLTGIVMTALIGILDFKTAKKLWKTSRNEFWIFMIAFFGVLVFGTVYGVVIGVMLSFMEVAISAVNPPTDFAGRIPEHGNFHSLSRNIDARPIQNTIIYRFSGNLFFANIDKFQSDIENALKEDTKQVVVDARGIGSIDITAAERLVALNSSLRKRGILFYFTEHDGTLNDELRRLGAEKLLTDGVVRKTITLALLDAGLEKPYMLEEADSENESDDTRKHNMHFWSEYDWLYGSSAKDKSE